MRVLRTIREVRDCIGAWRKDERTVGLVPTMGAIHEGHLRLVDHSRDRCDRSLATIFVNPLQFARGEDFDSYPRDEPRDMRLLESRGCDALFAPSPQELFPLGVADPADMRTSIHVHGLADQLCGMFRPGHFSGIATQVMKLFMISTPHVAFFGEKDYQQLQVVSCMVRELNVPVEIVPVATMREPDGLAMSSRNAYLDRTERIAAPLLYQALLNTAEALRRGCNVASTLDRARTVLLEGGFASVDYVALTAGDTLEPMTRLDKPARLLAAAWLGRARLIDNVPVCPS
jgi:pantoate--beta-alanine ligase